MKDNFECFCSFIYIDVMQQVINKGIFTYIKITMYNEMELVCICCEYIIFSERNEAYKDIIDFCIDDSPGSQ